MKKFAIFCLALAVAAMFVPTARAATKCYHLTNFCDGLEANNVMVGGNAGTITVGLWDFVCLGNGTGTLVAGAPNKFGGQPIYPYNGGTGQGFAAVFAFKPLTHMFDLYATPDGTTVFAFQLNQPFTTTKGPCNPLTPAQKALPGATLVQ